MDTQNLQKIVKKVQAGIVRSSTEAGSGHPTSSLSATELMVSLMFGGFIRYDLQNPKRLSNDRIIFSKGHASPLYFSLFNAAKVLTDEQLLTFRKFDSNLEGHPTPRFEHIDITTGSLGQGLSAGFGIALGHKALAKSNGEIDRMPKTFVLLGDSEIAEGQIWEAMQLAGHYKQDNLVGILDVNRLGQRGETMLGWDIDAHAQRIRSFGWEVITVEDGHNLEMISEAYKKMESISGKPVMIVAKTHKGHGISLTDNHEDYHGKPIPIEDLEKALSDIGEIDNDYSVNIESPTFDFKALDHQDQNLTLAIKFEKDKVATREAYGDGLKELARLDASVVAFDAETSNSTKADKIKGEFPDRFYEMYIAEQNMISAAAGMSTLGFRPFVSTFAAFLSRGFDQIRMAQYSNVDLKLVGSHVGVSIGYDGPSQMGLEDVSMVRSILNSVVVYPSDAVSTAGLMSKICSLRGITYLRTTREGTPIIYNSDEHFEIGGSKVLKESQDDKAVIISAGITLHEALKAYELLKEKGIDVCIIDAYSIKPLDETTIKKHSVRVGHVIVVEDHYPDGGLGDAVRDALIGEELKFKHLAVRKIPRSGSPEELLNYEEIDAEAIVNNVLDI